jgi:hypothetical protein
MLKILSHAGLRHEQLRGSAGRGSCLSNSRRKLCRKIQTLGILILQTSCPGGAGCFWAAISLSLPRFWSTS